MCLRKKTINYLPLWFFKLFKLHLKMKFIKYFILTIGILLLAAMSGVVNAQLYHIELSITNQPENPVTFGWIQGDDFNVIDSAKIDRSNNKVFFDFPVNAHPGTYRLIFGKTAYARIMDEAPQQLDLIFNNENIVIQTDFKSPVANLNIIESNENKVWYSFQMKDILIKKDIQDLEQAVNRYWEIGEKEKAIDAAGQYNQLQLERDVFVKETADRNPGLLASVYIKNQRLPLLDGYLSAIERKDFYKKNFFQNLDFSDDRLINSSVYTDNVFEYLTHYNQSDFTKEQRENAYIQAVDVIFQKVNKNEKVYRFLMDYVVNGFKMLQLEKVIDYVRLKYNYK